MSYITNLGARLALGPMPFTGMSLHTHHPYAPPLTVPLNEYVGEGYARQDATFNEPEDRYRTLQQNVVFTGVPGEAVAWVGLWADGDFRGGLKLPEGTQFHSTTGILVILKDDTKIGVKEDDTGTDVTNGAFFSQSMADDLTEELLREISPPVQGGRPSQEVWLSLHTQDPGQSGSYEYDGEGPFGVYAQNRPYFSDAQNGVAYTPYNLMFTGAPDAAVPYCGIWRVNCETGVPAPPCEEQFLGAFELGTSLSGTATSGKFDDDLGILIILKDTRIGFRKGLQ